MYSKATSLLLKIASNVIRERANGKRHRVYARQKCTKCPRAHRSRGTCRGVWEFLITEIAYVISFGQNDVPYGAHILGLSWMAFRLGTETFRLQGCA